MAVTQAIPMTRHPYADGSYKKMLIDGKWVDAASGKKFETHNPATGELLATVAEGDAEDINRAVAAARRAFEGPWSKVKPFERQAMLLRLADIVEKNFEELSQLDTLDMGAPISRTRGNKLRVLGMLRYYAGQATALHGETIENSLPGDIFSYTLKEPVGVVGAIIPWNAPVLLGALKIAPALCAGNTLVLKTAEDAPLGVLLMAEICQQFLPPGVLNVLTGFGEECGGPLANHPGIAKLSFTGSTEVGKIVMRAAAERIVPVSLELGGKSPSIVYPDADQDWAVDGIIAAMRFTRQSQSCTAGSRLFLHEDIFDSFLGKLEKKTTALKIGDPLDEKTDIGTIINNKQFTKVCKYVDEGLKRSDAKLVFGGLPPRTGPLSEGYYALPTVFADRSNDWRLAREEIFGPVLVAIRWSDEAEAIRMANDSHYGLAAYVWTHDIGAGLRTAHAIESGWVQVNQGGGQVPGMSYGGYKQSGIGREFSLEGMLDSFTQRKSVTVNLAV